MSDIIYVPIIKVSVAETRGVETLSDEVKDAITPVFELARSRRTKREPEGDIFQSLKKIKEVYGVRQFILDLTSDSNSRNEQIDDLQNSTKGYRNWIKFLLLIKGKFPEIIPVIQISDIGVKSKEDFYDRIKKQVELLDENFNSVVYRFPLEYADFSSDLGAICEEISGDKIICVIDAGFITQEKSGIYSPKAVEVIGELEDFSLGKVVLVATSFHKNPTEFGGEEYGEFRLEECLFYEEVNNAVESELIYGDYATINPIRVLQAGGRGWVPRIDMPTEELVFYHRSRKRGLEASYATAYARVAEMICRDERYRAVRRRIGDCWGIEQIESSAEGYPQGLSPSFWISVRMNIHITLRTSLL
jgi:hypothetical protein